jgi:hypothetical protein
MTGLRAARINAGYRTAKDAYKVFAKGRKGREALSYSYFTTMESQGPRIISEDAADRLARLYGCSKNLIFAWKAEPNVQSTQPTNPTHPKTTKGKGGASKELPGSVSSDQPSRVPARTRAVVAE